jgi:hypothetical protein
MCVRSIHFYYYSPSLSLFIVEKHVYIHTHASFHPLSTGMIFQFVLTDKLIAHLEPIASSPTLEQQQPIIHPASQSLMSRVYNFNKSSYADNRSIFHGREIRKVSNARGGMGFVLQLSCADDFHGDDNDGEEEGDLTTTTLTGGSRANIQITKSITGENTMLPKGANAIWNGQPVDPQGWSLSEITTYDGWRSDTFRQWRNARMYESEAEGGGGYTNFSKEMGKDAYGLHHRFFLHYDDRGRMWLCAEDGCEGTPVNLKAKNKGLFGKLLGGMTMFGE